MKVLIARAERAEMALEDTRAATIRAMEAKAIAAQLRAEKAEEALEIAQRKAANELDNAQAAEEKQKEAEDKLKGAESEVFLLTGRLHSATIEVGIARERAENAEEIARRSDAHLQELKVTVAEVGKKAVKEGEKAAEMERRAIEAEKQTLEAVEKFRKSAAYEEELAEATAYAYEGGFQECKRKVQGLYKLEGIEDLAPGEVSEGEDSTSSE